MAPHPGYYRALVVAVDSVTPEDQLQEAAAGGYVQREVHSDVWLLVTESGGRVTDEFDASQMPEGVRPQPGPFRQIGTNLPDSLLARSTGESLARSAIQVASLASWTDGLVDFAAERLRSLMRSSRDGRAGADASGPYQYQVLYDAGGFFLRLPGALVQITHYPEFNGSLTEYQDNTLEVEALTDSQGRFQVDCFPDRSTYMAQVLVSDKFNVLVHPTFVGSDIGTYDDCANGTNLDRQIIVSAKPSQVYFNMKRVIPESRSLLGRSRGLVEVNLDPDAEFSEYKGWEDEIYIKSTEGDDHVFGDLGLFTAAHEYGHAVHEKAMGGINPHFCPEPHFVTEPSNVGCALTEGFADYHAVATTGPGARFDRTISKRDIDKVDGFPTGGNYDPAEIEGAFAAFLFDITDPADPFSEEQGTAHDSVAYPGSYVAEVIETCREPDDRADGTDHIVYCFEQAVRTEVTTHTDPPFFFRAGLPPNSISESATEPAGWDLSQIRSLWLHNIYGFNGPRPLDGGDGGDGSGAGGGGGGECEPFQIIC